MIIKFKKTDDKAMVVREIRNKINGNAPDGFSYKAEPSGDEIIFKVKPI